MHQTDPRAFPTCTSPRTCKTPLRIFLSEARDADTVSTGITNTTQYTQPTQKQRIPTPRSKRLQTRLQKSAGSFVARFNDSSFLTFLSRQSYRRVSQPTVYDTTRVIPHPPLTDSTSPRSRKTSK
ncbi:unnamed protein product, partial [Ectocarpus sp. 13 AM-2016]